MSVVGDIILGLGIFGTLLAATIIFVLIIVLVAAIDVSLFYMFYLYVRDQLYMHGIFKFILNLVYKTGFISIFLYVLYVIGHFAAQITPSGK